MPSENPMLEAPLTAEDRALLQEARRVRDHAYAPYSGFHVGAAVRTERGVFCGVNVENAAYPLAVCAERNAIAAAIAAGARTVEAVAVIADSPGPVSPCGGCRQVIFELGPDARVIRGSIRGGHKVQSIRALLPDGFGRGGELPPPPRPEPASDVPATAAARTAAGEGPLRGVKIVDLTRILAGPYATMRLADLGAEVWKVERPGTGDDTRAWGPPFVHGLSTYFLSVNRQKRSIALDLKRPAGKRALWRMIEAADVLVENFRPGVLQRLGFGWDVLRERKPDLIYCSISGYGHRSSHRDRPSYDVVIQAESGVMDLTGDPDGPPTKCGLSIADLVAGLNAAQGIVSALYRRRATGRGARCDIALFDGLLSLLAYQGQMQLSGQGTPRRLGNAHPSIVPYELFGTADGHLAIGVGNEAAWARFCDLLDRAAWREDPRFQTNRDRVAHHRELKPLIEKRLGQESSADWLRRLGEARIPAGRVNTVAEAFALAQGDLRGLLVDVQHPEAGRLTMVGNPVDVRAIGPNGRSEPPGPRAPLPPPGVGEHTEEILRRVGLRADEVQALRDEGAFG